MTFEQNIAIMNAYQAKSLEAFLNANPHANTKLVERAFSFAYQSAWNNCEQQQAEVIANLEEAKPRWIPVSERPPESGKKVLARYQYKSGKKCVVCAFYADKFAIGAEFAEECCQEYDEIKDEYYLEQGWYEVIDNWDDFSSIRIYEGEVYEWMEIPE